MTVFLVLPSSRLSNIIFCSGRLQHEAVRVHHQAQDVLLLLLLASPARNGIGKLLI